MPVPDHLIPVVKRIKKLDVSPPPEPWELRGGSGVGGLTEVGFGPGTDMLLVVSHQGRGVFDCATGERIARDRLDDYSYHHGTKLLANGIGLLEGKQIPLAGLAGGGLASSTEDGWSVDDFVLDWPDHTLLLSGPHSWPYDVNGPLWKLGIESELRAWGFSSTGKTLVLATSSDVVIWGRNGGESQ